MRKEPLEMGSNTASASNRGRTSETPPLPHKAVAPLLDPKPTFPPKQQAHPGRRRGSERVPAQQARSTEANPETPSRSRRSLLERTSNLTHSRHAPAEELPVRRRYNGATRCLARCAPIEDGAPRTRPRLGAASEKPPYTPARQPSTSQSYIRLTKEKVSYRPVRSKAGMKLSAAAGPSCQ